MGGVWKKAAALTLLLAACWGAMVGVDYHRCTRMEEPIFADIDHNVICQACYRGLGYTIVLDYDGCVWQSDFFWGWGGGRAENP